MDPDPSSPCRHSIHLLKNMLYYSLLSLSLSFLLAAALRRAGRLHGLKGEWCKAEDVERTVEFFTRNALGSSVSQVTARMSSSSYVLPCGVKGSAIFAVLTGWDLWRSAEGVYTPSTTVTQLRVQRFGARGASTRRPPP